MKCKNCGAEYKAREQHCPYCHTENIIGKIWQSERSLAEKEYEAEKKKVGKELCSPYMADRILNRSLVVIACLYLVSFLVVVLVFFLEDVFHKVWFSFQEEKIVAQMDEYYHAGELEKLDIYMDEQGVDLEKFYAYTQATILNFDYNRYMEYRLGFAALPEEKKLQDEYYLEKAIQYSGRVYRLDCGNYSELSEQNKALYEAYQKEIMAYWVGTLQLSEEDITLLTEAEYLYSDEMDAIVDRIKERRCFE